MVRHWTPKPVIISCIRSTPPGGNFYFAVVNSFEYNNAISANFVQIVKNSIVKGSGVTLTPHSLVGMRPTVADPGGAEGAMPPPGPVKISHKKDGHWRRPHRFHVSRPPPLPGCWIRYWPIRSLLKVMAGHPRKPDQREGHLHATIIASCIISCYLRAC